MGEHRFMAGFAFRAPGVPSPCHPAVPAANAAALRLRRGPVPAAGAVPALGMLMPSLSPLPGGVSAVPAARVVPAAGAIPTPEVPVPSLLLSLSPRLVPSPLPGSVSAVPAAGAIPASSATGAHPGEAACP